MMKIIFVGIALAMSQWTIAAPKLPETTQMIKQDANLHRVDERLYRSEQLTQDDVDIIQQLGIKTLISLRYFNRHENEKLFATHDLTLLNQPLLTWRIKPKDIAQVLYIIEQKQKDGAVLVHCYHGADRTGTMIAMYRIVQQGWTIEDAKHEMQNGGYGYHSIWKNLDRLFRPEVVAEVKAELAKLRAVSP